MAERIERHGSAYGSPARDILYTKPDGTKARYRHDAQVQNLSAARAEDRRRLSMLASTGSPLQAATDLAAPEVAAEWPRAPRDHSALRTCCARRPRGGHRRSRSW